MDVDHRAQRLALAEVLVDERPPRRLPDALDLVVARRQPGQVGEDDLLVDEHQVDRPRLPRHRRRAREVLLAQQVVEQARLARVRLAGDADVRQVAHLEQPLRKHRLVRALQHVDRVAVVADEEVAVVEGVAAARRLRLRLLRRRRERGARRSADAARRRQREAVRRGGAKEERERPARSHQARRHGQAVLLSPRPQDSVSPQRITLHITKF